MLRLLVVVNYILVIATQNILAETGITANVLKVEAEKLPPAKIFLRCLQSTEEDLPADSGAILGGVIYILKQTLPYDGEISSHNGTCYLNITTALEIYLENLELSNEQLNNLVTFSLVFLKCSESFLPQDSNIVGNIKCFMELVDNKIDDTHSKFSLLQRQTAVMDSDENMNQNTTQPKNAASFPDYNEELLTTDGHGLGKNSEEISSLDYDEPFFKKDNDIHLNLAKDAEGRMSFPDHDETFFKKDDDIHLNLAEDAERRISFPEHNETFFKKDNDTHLNLAKDAEERKSFPDRDETFFKKDNDIHLNLAEYTEERKSFPDRDETFFKKDKDNHLNFVKNVEGKYISEYVENVLSEGNGVGAVRKNDNETNSFSEVSNKTNQIRRLREDFRRLLCDLVAFTANETFDAANKLFPDNYTDAYENRRVSQLLSQKLCTFQNGNFFKLPVQENESANVINQAFYSNVTKELISSKIWSKILGKSISPTEAAEFFYEWSFAVEDSLGKSNPGGFARKIAEMIRTTVKVKTLTFYVRTFTYSLSTFLNKHGLLKLYNTKELAHEFTKAIKRASIYIHPNGRPISYINALIKATLRFLVDKFFLNLKYTDSFISNFSNELKKENDLHLREIPPDIFSTEMLFSNNATSRVTALAEGIVTILNSTYKSNVDSKSLLQRIIISMALYISVDNHNFKTDGLVLEALFEVLSALLTILKNSQMTNYSNTNIE